MPVAVAMVIIFGVVVFAIALIGLLWAIVFLLAFYAYVGIAVYLIWRSNRRKALLEASVVREVERQRLFNEQEMRAWNSSLDDDRQEPPVPEKVSRYQPAPSRPRTSEDR
jgi:uncharacterized protein (DUF58 family)